MLTIGAFALDPPFIFFFWWPKVYHSPKKAQENSISQALACSKYV